MKSTSCMHMAGNESRILDSGVHRYIGLSYIGSPVRAGHNCLIDLPSIAACADTFKKALLK